MPKPTPFDASIPAHMDFVLAASRLKARTLGLPALQAADVSGSAAVDRDAPSSDHSLWQLLDAIDAAAAAAIDDTSSGQDRNERLAAAFAAQEETFEKDDDANGHIDFITAASNLRATNYGIPTADRHKTKLVAGKIVPAIATATAAAVGLIGVELLKLATLGALEGAGFNSEVNGGQAMSAEKALGAYRNAYLNLALPLLAESEPEPPAQYTLQAIDGQVNAEVWTEWDRVEVSVLRTDPIRPYAALSAVVPCLLLRTARRTAHACPQIDRGAELPLSSLVDELEERFHREVSFLSLGGMTIYSSLSPPAAQSRWMPMLVGTIAAELSGQVPDGASRWIQLQASCYDETLEEDVEVPMILYRSYA